MPLKLLISGEPNAGKTSLLRGLEDTLVISHDGKRFPLDMPHVNVTEVTSCDEFTTTVLNAVEAYNEKLGSYPKYVAFDSVSKIFESFFKYCDSVSSDGFKAYAKLDSEVGEFMSFLEDTLLAEGVGVIALSHCVYNAEAGKYQLTGKGAFNKRGGFLCETDEALFVETSKNSRTVHAKSLKYPARTLVDGVEDKVAVSKFDLQKHVEKIEKTLKKSSKFELTLG